MKLIFLYLFLFTAVFASENYNKLFLYLEKKGIILEEDISIDELYKMKENGKLYLRNGELNTNELDEKFSSIFKKRVNALKKSGVESYDSSDNSNTNGKIEDHSKLFYYLEENGVRLEQDVSIEELYNMKEAGLLYLKNGELNLKALNKKLNIVLKYREEEARRLEEQLNKNDGKINRAVKQYIKDNNDAINEAQEKIKEQSTDEDGWFVKIVNSILDMLKQ